MRNKRKGILMACSILGSAAIVSTGFAAWVITAPQEQTATGNIDVDSVRDDRLTITPSWDTTSNGSVYFGAPSTMNLANAWLKNDTVRKSECMDMTLSLDLAFNEDNGKTKADIDGTLTVDFAIDGGKTMDSTLIETPKFEASYNVVDGKVSIPFSFKWGTYFGENDDGTTKDVNPYNFYNDGNHEANDPIEQDSSTTWADDALSKLTTIHGYNDYSFTITVEFTWA